MADHSAEYPADLDGLLLSANTPSSGGALLIDAIKEDGRDEDTDDEEVA